ncbi:unnamed protein product, partial [Meganyctiphanes norvegica]
MNRRTVYFVTSISLIEEFRISRTLRGAMCPAIWNAKLKEGQYPVIVFSHGLSANRSFYSSFCTEMASNGFIVAAVEHRDRSACASFILNEGGEKEFLYFKTLDPDTKEYELRNQQIKVRVEESIRTLDVLEKLNIGGLKDELESGFDLSQLVGRLDLSQVVMSGHSFGGGTTINTLAKDKRFKIGVALDPWLFPIKDDIEDIGPKVSQPLICISTERFQTKANLSAMNNLPEETANFVTIKGTVHQNQADTPFVLNYIGRVIGGTSSTLDPHVAMDINNNLALRFICKQLVTSKQESIAAAKRILEDNKNEIIYGLYSKL